MLSHVCLGTRDFDRAYAFYAPLMAHLGYPLKFANRERPWAAWKPAAAERPLFVIGKPFEGEAATGNGQMVALLAPDRAAVDSGYRMALEMGARCEGAPGLRPQYHLNFYGSYFRDPDGNKLCLCCHDPAP